ncbi:hypothetical protein ACIO3R_33000 [Streptomyces sp. NPDC087428]|uniref:hypothetical protein n=1 Tax=Streptomyces sp. NPDC087428 TaxID=3365788 RepID=UPI0037FC2277
MWVSVLISVLALVVGVAGYRVVLWNKRRVRTDEFRVPATCAQETFMIMEHSGLPLDASLLKEARQHQPKLAAAARRAAWDPDMGKALQDLAQRFAALVDSSIPRTRETRDEFRRRERQWERQLRVTDESFTDLFTCLDGGRKR